MKKKVILIIMLLFLVLTQIPINTFAQVSIGKLTATKEAIKTNKVGEYDINISVPGQEHEEVSSYNVLFVIDASESMANSSKWTSTRNALLEMVDILLPENQESNVNKIGLVSFGIDWHLNIELTNNRTEFYNLPENYYDASEKLLAPGRSATNTEAALSGANQYLRSLSNSSKKDKEHTYVVFLTDGAANYSEAKYNFYELSRTKDSNGNYPSYRGIVIMQHVRDTYAEVLYVLENNKNITAPSFFYESISEIKSLYTESNPETTEVDFMTMLQSFENNEKYEAIIDAGVVKYYDYKGIDIKKSYSINEMERAYFSNKTTNDAGLEAMLENAWYVQMITKHPTSNTIEIERTIEAGKKLAEISTVFTIGFNASGDESQQILNPEYYSNKTGKEHYSSGYSNASTATLKEKFEEITQEIVQIKYKNATVVDYTSKWVQPLDVNGDNIFDENDITIYNNNQKVEVAGIKVEKLSKEEIEVLNDPELIENTNGDIYRITWNITEYLRSWDKFTLSYKVKVDTQENEFISENEYKANGTTILTYDIISKSNIHDEETILKENEEYDIVVPVVKQKENIIIIQKNDEDNKLLAGADFEIEENSSTANLKKEYSTDGQTWTNNKENATYFKFSGLYNDLYSLNEINTPDGYKTTNNQLINFFNQEGEIKYIELVNERLRGKVIVHFIDDAGNVLVEEIIMDEIVGEKYTTAPKDINNFELIKVEGNENGLYIDGEIHITYIYQANKEITPPHTNVESIDIQNYFIPAIIEKRKKYYN